jgi:hypothetical protein
MEINGAVDYGSMTDEMLLDEVHRLASSVSYYNAAEGNWSSETADRVATNAKFRAAREELARRNMMFENRGYLL